MTTSPLINPGLESPWLNAVVMAVAEAIVGTTMQDTIVIWSRGSQSLLGYSRSEMLGRPRSLLSPPSERADLRALREKVVSSRQSVSQSLAWQCKDGVIRPFAVLLSPVYDTIGHFSGTIEIVRPEEMAVGSANAEAVTPVQPVEESAWRPALERLAHELSESIMAIGNYLAAEQELLNCNTPSDTLKLRTAIRESLTQVSRARDVLLRLRSLARCGEHQ
jgi:PAS domain S-box-containing protein